MTARYTSIGKNTAVIQSTRLYAIYRRLTFNPFTGGLTTRKDLRIIRRSKRATYRVRLVGRSARSILMTSTRSIFRSQYVRAVRCRMVTSNIRKFIPMIVHARYITHFSLAVSWMTNFWLMWAQMYAVISQPRLRYSGMGDTYKMGSCLTSGTNSCELVYVAGSKSPFIPDGRTVLTGLSPGKPVLGCTRVNLPKSYESPPDEGSIAIRIRELGYEIRRQNLSSR